MRKVWKELDSPGTASGSGFSLGALAFFSVVSLQHKSRYSCHYYYIMLAVSTAHLQCLHEEILTLGQLWAWKASFSSLCLSHCCFRCSPDTRTPHLSC